MKRKTTTTTKTSGSIIFKLQKIKDKESQKYIKDKESEKMPEGKNTLAIEKQR